MGKKIIYGTGEYGKKVFSMYDSGQDNPDIYFCRTDAKKNETYMGQKVICLDELEQYNDLNTQVIIAIQNKMIVSEIKNLLISKGFLWHQILDINSLFDDNLITVQNNKCTDSKKLCIICRNLIEDFTPAGETSELFSKHQIIGGGYRSHAICPVCNSLDRERWQYYVLQNETNIFKEKCRVLHIAPEQSTYRMTRANPYCDYYAGDIQIGRTMHQVDLTNIQFCDNYFDYIIANHVFEHISNEKIMFDEIKRVLRTDGKLICSFPICLDMNTYEDTNIISDEARLKYYGQKDHVRLYGKDYKEHIEQYGFSVTIKSPEQDFNEEQIKNYGFIRNDIILICSKIF